MRRAVLLLVVVFSLALAACLPPQRVVTLPPGKPVPAAPAPAQGFDAACAPSLTAMTAWWNASPYTSTSVYLPGASSLYCRVQPNLTPNWVDSVVAQGWNLMPLWVGPQAPCTTLTDVSKITADPTESFWDGIREAQLAANSAASLHIDHGPIYADIESYPRGGPCSVEVQNFANGWVVQLHARGFQGGIYSSLCSGILDLSASVGTPGITAQDSIWVAAWPYNSDDPRYSTYVPNLFGLGGCPANLPDTQWVNHERLRQFRGGHNETWGGSTINIDTNAVDGLTFP